MQKRSAGLLMYRLNHAEVEVFLVHPGGPYFAQKGKGSWTVPKGEYVPEEEPLTAARREFQEETGFQATAPFLVLDSIRQKGGKIVTAWAFEGDCDASSLRSNTCEIGWPPRSGRTIVIPEVDRGAWFTLTDGREHIREDQQPLLDRLSEALESRQT